MTPLETSLARIDQLATEGPDLLAFPSVPPDRLRALLFGLAIGDALGNTTESRRPRDRARDHGEITGYLPNRHAGGRRLGLPSDDTQMAFWLLEQLLDTGRLDPDALAQTFATRDIYGIGQSVREFRTNLNRGIPWDRAGSDSAGNGAIMRVAPMLVLQPHRTGTDLARDIATCAAVTHNEPGAIASSVAWVRLLALLSAGTGGPDRKDILELFLETHAPLEGPTSYRPRGGGMLDLFEGTCVDAPLDASGNLGTVGHVIRCGRVSGLEDAACHAPRACMEICRSGPVRLPALGRAAFAMMVLPTRSLDRLPLRSLAPSHIRRQPDDKGL